MLDLRLVPLSRVVAIYEEAIERDLSAEYLDLLLDKYRRVAATHEGPHEEYLGLLARHGRETGRRRFVEQRGAPIGTA